MNINLIFMQRVFHTKVSASIRIMCIDIIYVMYIYIVIYVYIIYIISMSIVVYY